MKEIIRFGACEFNRQIFGLKKVLAFEHERGRIKKFRVQLLVLIGEDWYELRRYDTAHGRTHMHKFLPDGRTETSMVENGNLKELFDRINKEIKENAEKWVKNYLLRK